MFEKTIEIVEDLGYKNAIEHKKLTTLQKLHLADECLRDVKSPQEYKEILNIKDELQKQFQLEKRFRDYGVNGTWIDHVSKNVIDTEGAADVRNTFLEELKIANQRYSELQSIVSSALGRYLDETEEALKEMVTIEKVYQHSMNHLQRYLPIHTDLGTSSIPYTHKESLSLNLKYTNDALTSRFKKLTRKEDK